jgi:hypothetical protein
MFARRRGLRLSGAKAACSVHGSPAGCPLARRVHFSGLSRTEAGIYPAESHAEDCATCGREAVKSVLRLFDELVKCEGGEILKDVRKAAEGMDA